MKIKIIICSLLLIVMVFLSVPSVTMAAWWNPLSWSWNPLTWFHKTTTIQPVQKTQQPDKSGEIQAQTPVKTQANNTISQPSERNIIPPKTISPTPPVSSTPTPDPTPAPAPLSGLEKMDYCMKLATQEDQQAKTLAEADKKKCEDEGKSSLVCFVLGSTPNISSYYSACLGTSPSSGNGSTSSPPSSLFPSPSLSEKELQKMCDLVNGIYRSGNCY